ncbi:MAG: type II toxin-antitoxin system RelE/ParE family toxin [Spirochaetia bacterium]|nr:type II toxin-antitoxin system RelE/ParE family toxin [Spirochaetia bacterium]
MIKSFADRETQRIYYQEKSLKFPDSIQKIALRKLIMIDNAEKLDDLRIPPGNHLELLHGNRTGQYSIRINDKFRICFREHLGDFYDLEIVDYH